MTPEAIVNIPLSRPKVHRLPALPTRHPKIWHPDVMRTGAFMRQKMSKRPFLFTCSAGIATIALVVLMNGFVSMVAYHVSALPNDRSQITMKNAPETPLIAGIGDAQASTVASEKHGETIIITGESGKIIGQMAKMPPQSEQAVDIHSISAVDNNAGRELLSIVSKY